jgi:hypothetical protein
LFQIVLEKTLQKISDFMAPNVQAVLMFGDQDKGFVKQRS